MIGRISGTLLEKNPPQVQVDANGVGYDIDVPMSTFYNLPRIGDKVALFTHLVVREDAQLLYGFGTESERTAFRTLIKVSGVGPKVALALLSGLSVNDLAAAVAMQETGRLTNIPGIGKKTAERLLLELKDKFKVDPRGVQREGSVVGGEGVTRRGEPVGRYSAGAKVTFEGLANTSIDGCFQGFLLEEARQ
jgi:Holliday junction DNA helicase RuvA